MRNLKNVKGKNAKKKGFTLIELIAVIAILGILAAIIIPNIGGFTKKAKVAKAVSDAKNIVNAIDSYNAELDGSGTKIEDTDAINATIMTSNIIGTGKTIKVQPSEFANATTVAQLRTASDKSKFDESASPATGTFDIDKNGTVIFK